MREYDTFIEKILVQDFCPGFDEGFYASKYLSYISNKVSPLEHYLKYGWKLNMDPRQGFSGASYFAANTDVYNNGLNPLVHYLMYGLKEGRSVTGPANRTKAIAAHMEAGKSPPFSR